MRIKKQQPGQLPAGADENSWLTPQQFWTWRRRSRNWFSRNKRKLPGVHCRTRKDVAVHVGMHLRGVFPGLAGAMQGTRGGPRG